MGAKMTDLLKNIFVLGEFHSTGLKAKITL